LQPLVPREKSCPPQHEAQIAAGCFLADPLDAGIAPPSSWPGIQETISEFESDLENAA